MGKIPAFSVNNGRPYRRPVAAYAASGVIKLTSGGQVMLTKTGVGVMTLAAPAENGLTLTVISTTAQAHTVTVATTWGGVATTIATFGGAIGDGFDAISYGSKWWIIRNLNITLS